MFASVAVALAIGASAAYAAPSSFNATIPRGCASHISLDQQQAAELDFSIRRTSIASLDALATGPIPVVWHVIYADETLTGGFVPDEQVVASITDMNTHFANTGFTFELTKTVRTLNAAWFKEVGPDEQNQTDMKNALREGDAATLNVYSVGFQSGSGQGLLGYATFPSWYADAPKDDGVVLLYSSVPGGSTVPYDQGKTLTHEVGHWLGLYHVFQGGCSGAGDEVADTPAQRTATSGCPASQDSCPGGGVDSVHNFMDYSYDACMYEWSAGQVTRAVDQVAAFRGIQVTPPTPGEPTSSTVVPSSTEVPSSTVVPSSTEVPTTVVPSTTVIPSTTVVPTSTSISTISSSTTTSAGNCPWWWPNCPWSNW